MISASVVLVTIDLPANVSAMSDNSLEREISAMELDWTDQPGSSDYQYACTSTDPSGGGVGGTSATAVGPVLESMNSDGSGISAELAERLRQLVNGELGTF